MQVGDQRKDQEAAMMQVEVPPAQRSMRFSTSRNASGGHAMIRRGGSVPALVLDKAVYSSCAVRYSLESEKAHACSEHLHANTTDLVCACRGRGGARVSTRVAFGRRYRRLEPSRHEHDLQQPLVSTVWQRSGGDYSACRVAGIRLHVSCSRHPALFILASCRMRMWALPDHSRTVTGC